MAECPCPTHVSANTDIFAWHQNVDVVARCLQALHVGFTMRVCAVVCKAWNNAVWASSEWRCRLILNMDHDDALPSEYQSWEELLVYAMRRRVRQGGYWARPVHGLYGIETVVRVFDTEDDWLEAMGDSPNFDLKTEDIDAGKCKSFFVALNCVGNLYILCRDNTARFVPVSRQCEASCPSPVAPTPSKNVRFRKVSLFALPSRVQAV